MDNLLNYESSDEEEQRRLPSPPICISNKFNNAPKLNCFKKPQNSNISSFIYINWKLDDKTINLLDKIIDELNKEFKNKDFFLEKLYLDKLKIHKDLHISLSYNIIFQNYEKIDEFINSINFFLKKLFNKNNNDYNLNIKFDNFFFLKNPITNNFFLSLIVDSITKENDFLKIIIKEINKLIELNTIEKKKFYYDSSHLHSSIAILKTNKTNNNLLDQIDQSILCTENKKFKNFIQGLSVNVDSIYVTRGTSVVKIDI